MTTEEDRVIKAVLYAMKEGCFFPVRQPKLTAPIHKWVKWGAMRHLHDTVADLTKAGC